MALRALRNVFEKDKISSTKRPSAIEPEKSKPKVSVIEASSQKSKENSEKQRKSKTSVIEAPKTKSKNSVIELPRLILASSKEKKSKTSVIEAPKSVSGPAATARDAAPSSKHLSLSIKLSRPSEDDTTPTKTPTKNTHNSDSLQSGHTPIASTNSNTSDTSPYRVKLHLSPRTSKKSVFTPTEASHSQNEDEDETMSEGGFEDDEQIIFEAIKNQDYDALVDYINDDEIDANEMTSGGRRYLHECVTYDDQEAAELVLDAGGQINARDIFGWTSLHFAAAFNLQGMTQYLLNRGADPRKKTKEGELAEEITESQEIVQLLQVARARRGLRSISTVSITDIEAAKEEFERRQRGRKSRDER